MTNSGHTSRTLQLSKASPGWLIVSRGSEGNDDPLAAVEASGHSQIRAFDVGAQRDAPYNYPSDGRQLGWGLRNSVGIAEHPVTGGVWSVENSVDDLTRSGIDIHADNPGEELNYHGTLENIEGGNYGYPMCYALWSTDAPFPSLGDMTTGSQFAADREGNQSLTNDTACNTAYKAPVLTLQAHTAPLDIKFDKNGSSAFVSYHGSCEWQVGRKADTREPPREGRVQRQRHRLGLGFWAPQGSERLQGRGGGRVQQQGPDQVPEGLLPPGRPGMGHPGAPVRGQRHDGRDLRDRQRRWKGQRRRTPRALCGCAHGRHAAELGAVETCKGEELCKRTLDTVDDLTRNACLYGLDAIATLHAPCAPTARPCSGGARTGWS